MFIVEFPGEWYLKTPQGRVTGDKDEAQRFPDETEARKALDATKLRFKPQAYRGAKIIAV